MKSRASTTFGVITLACCLPAMLSSWLSLFVFRPSSSLSACHVIHRDPDMVTSESHVSSALPRFAPLRLSCDDFLILLIPPSPLITLSCLPFILGNHPSLHRRFYLAAVSVLFLVAARRPLPFII